MKLSQTEIARLTGYSARHINRIFRRKTLPSIKLALNIERVTGIPWDSWFASLLPVYPAAQASPPGDCKRPAL